MMRLVMTAQNPVATVDAFGQAQESWLSFANIPVHIETANTEEGIGDGGVEVRTDWRILAAFHPSVTTRSRLLLVDNGVTRTFFIRGCWDRDQKRRRLEINAVEVTV
jgi:head-tail adaptor